MFGVEKDYQELFEAASSLAQRKVASQYAVQTQAEKDAKLRTYLMVGGAGVCGLILLALILRRSA